MFCSFIFSSVFYFHWFLLVPLGVVTVTCCFTARLSAKGMTLSSTKQHPLSSLVHQFISSSSFFLLFIYLFRFLSPHFPVEGIKPSNFDSCFYSFNGPYLSGQTFITWNFLLTVLFWSLILSSCPLSALFFHPNPVAWLPFEIATVVPLLQRPIFLIFLYTSLFWSSRAQAGLSIGRPDPFP